MQSCARNPSKTFPCSSTKKRATLPAFSKLQAKTPPSFCHLSPLFSLHILSTAHDCILVTTYVFPASFSFHLFTPLSTSHLCTTSLTACLSTPILYGSPLHQLINGSILHPLLYHSTSVPIHLLLPSALSCPALTLLTNNSAPCPSSPHSHTTQTHAPRTLA